MLDSLLLLSGNDIPFLEAQIVIHQPTIKEIAYIGEEAFKALAEEIDKAEEYTGAKGKSFTEMLDDLEEEAK